jgi:hypothetical protein
MPIDPKDESLDGYCGADPDAARKILENRRIEYLLRGADFLEKVPANTFDIDDWQASRASQTLVFDGTFECGFAGCAIGWMAHAKIFPGFTMGCFEPAYGELRSWDAVEELFGISESEAMHLFSVYRYTLGEGESVTPSMVAARMRQLAKEKVEM